MKNDIFFKSRLLVLARMSATSNEYKIYNRILLNGQCINSEKLTSTITIKEIREALGTDNIFPADVIKYLDRFRENTLRLPGENEEEESDIEESNIEESKTKRKVGTGLIERWESEDYDTFTCFLYPKIYELLSNYNEVGYAPLQLRLFNKTKSYYTQKIYEMLRVWSGNKREIIYPLKELREGTGTENIYLKYSNYKARIIIPVVEEINSTKSFEMYVRFEEIKVKRTVVAIKFIVYDRLPRKVEFVELLKIPSTELLAQSTLDELKKAYDDSLVDEAYAILKERNEVETIKSPLKYITSTLENLKKRLDTPYKKAPKALRFHNFEGRQYTQEEYKALEDQLLYGNHNDYEEEEENI